MCAFWTAGMQEVRISAYVPGQESTQSSTTMSNSYPSFSSEFTSTAALDISDDDLPF